MIDFGMSHGDFKARCFERQVHVFRDALSERPFTWRDVDELLHVVEPGAPRMRMFHHGIVAEQEYIDEAVELRRPRRKLNKLKFYDYMRNGATLVINWVEDYSVAAKRLCTEIARFARAPASGNAYMSFTGDGTFGKHWDTHDVIAIQLIGRKRWRVFPPTLPLPLTYQTNERTGHECPAEPAHEFTLEEGDMAYLPRGWWHHVIPRDEGSFHLSVGLYAPTVYDYVLWTLSKTMERRADMRRSFSPAEDREELAAAVSELSQVLIDPASVAAFEHDALAREPVNAEFNLGLFFDSSKRLPRGDAILSLNTCHRPALENGVMLVKGAQLGLDADAATIVAALRDCASLKFDELCASLPNISRDAIRLAVLNLARHDIVTIQE